MERTELDVQAERAVLVSVILPGSSIDMRNPLGELDRLAKTAGANVVDYMIQRRNKIDPVYYLGSGKAEELCERAEASDAALIIFDNDLSPAQIRELEKITKCKIIDRSELILDIFASRAKTHQARLQVELAQLEYAAPRLRGMWTHLERIAGAGGGTGAGIVGGIGTRGPGERQIEIDRRIVSKRISLLKERLEEIDARKKRQVKSRDDEYKISLVGYTNAGKSTLMNALTGAGVKSEDRLFSTLDTTTRKWNLSGGMVALLSDTVGFVRDLPHHLVASFRATLEEAIYSDLMFIVVDASSRTAELELNSVKKVLETLSCENQERLILLNKCDIAEDPSECQIIESQNGSSLRISAKTGMGLDKLHDYVLNIVRKKAIDITIKVNVSDGKVLSYLDRHAYVLNRRYFDDTVELDIRVSQAKFDQLKNRVGGIEILT